MAANQTQIRIAPDFEQRYQDASATATECAMNLVLTADLLVKRISELLKPYDLSPASGLVLSILADSETPLPPHRIAEKLIISRATTTGLLDSLERRGYARRISHPSDRRMLLVELTDIGRQVAETFRPIVHQHQKMWLEVLSEADQKRLLASLHRLQAALLEAEA
jgi:DNA-binding MarR family transcriptional regulator